MNKNVFSQIKDKISWQIAERGIAILTIIVLIIGLIVQSFDSISNQKIQEKQIDVWQTIAAAQAQNPGYGPTATYVANQIATLEATLRALETSNGFPKETTVLPPNKPASSPFPTFTLVPTYTFYPTFTPYPTYTQLPTYTLPPAPTNTTQSTLTATPALILPFLDTFDNAIRPEWLKVSGEPVIIGGRLTSRGSPLILTLQDDSLGDYTIGFDCWGCFNMYYDDVVFIIAQQFQFSFGRVQYLQVPSNSGGTKIFEAGSNDNGRIELKISGNSYRTYFNSNPMIDNIVFGEPLYGPLTLKLAPDVVIDNFSLVSNK